MTPQTVLIRQFLGGKRHSWQQIAQGFTRAFIKQGITPTLYSTDGIEYLADDLKPYLIGYTDEKTKKRFGKLPTDQYDMSLSYTLPTNWGPYLANSTKNRFAIYTYEWDAPQNPLPFGYAKHYKSCDLILAPSNFSKDIFLHAGIPESHIKVLPHGIDDGFASNETTSMPTTKTCKILANIVQNHRRKNIPALLEAYGKAFTKQDDVCLILKAKLKPVQADIEVNLKQLLDNFYKQFPNHAEVKLYDAYVDNIATIYNSIDIVFTMSHCEGYWMPGTEAICAGKVCVAPRYGGQLDFLNDDNALLVDGKIERADPKAMYWMMNEKKPNAVWFQPSVDDAVSKLRYAYGNYQTLNAKLASNKHIIQQQYSWDNIANQVIDLCQ
jgi:O-antigen biosynthesis alpha-1,2-mannosyltransferase